MRLALRFVTAALLLAGATATAAELRGHGGPVRAIAVTQDGAVITGSFDSRAIVWSLETGAAREVLLFHAGQVNAVAALPDGRFATGGADGRVAVWTPGQGVPARVLEGHGAPVAALAVSPDGLTLASASWDTSVRLWPLSGRGDPRVLEGHRGNVNAVGFLADGTPVSAGYDGNLIFWPQEPAAGPVTVPLPAPLNALATLPGDLVAVAGADGSARVLDRSGTVRAQAQVASGPVVALAVSPDGRELAAAGLDGSVAVLDAASLAPMRELAGEGSPVWSLAFAPDGETLLIGGADRVVREWDVESGELFGAAAGDPMAEFAGNPDAEAFRACVACHTLDPDDGNRAGPTLHGIFGRRIASVPGYRYSPALRGLNIVWTPETVAKLFELGPHRFTPGTKMPEQRIGDAEDRAALIRFLQSAARAE
jgi:cytochrome c